MGLFPGEARALCDTPLLAGGEVWVGGAGDAQTCVGDSGGPLLVEREGERAVVGVASWVYRSQFGACHKGGAAYAVFHDDVLPLLDRYR
jgi:secreted trypsin-like serine protease